MLPEQTTRAIEAFSKRRKELILARGLCALVVSLIVVMSGLALLDRFLILPDGIRWALSIAGYGAIALLFWRVCLRQLTGRENQRQTARLIEKARPDLREDLLSAVELDETKDEHESPVFRSLLQQDVAGRLSETKADELLPASLIKPWIKGAAAAALLFVVLMFTPHFLQLFSRALLPGANLARPSDIQIVFVAPDPPDRVVPTGDTQPLEVKIEGGDVERVSLETVTADGDTQRVRLDREAGNRFVGSIKVGADDVRYRVRARGTITRFHTLQSRPRPAVSEFAKTYTPPSYTELPPYIEKHEHGDLSGLEGTAVTLDLAVNAEMAEAELRLESDTKSVEPLNVPLETTDSGSLTATLQLDGRHNTYSVHLVAAESGFENTFAPLYEIRTVPDMVPKAELAAPEDGREVRAEETIAMRGSASDDVLLAEVRHAYRINNGDWIEVSLATRPGKEWEFAQEWPLRLLPLRGGDTIITKLVAFDAKGNKGESAPVRLAVTGEVDNSEQREWAERERELAKELTALEEKAAQAMHETHRAAKAMKKDDEERDVEDQQQIVRADNAVEEARDQAEEVLEQLKEALAEAPGRAEAEQLEAIADKVADAKEQGLERLADKMEDAAAGRDEPLRDDHHRPAHLASDALENTRRATDAMRALAAEDAAALAAEDLEQLADTQQAIAQDARETPEGEREPVAERQDLAAQRAEAMEEQLRDLAEQMESAERKRVENMARTLDQQGERLEQAMEADDAARRLPEAARQMEQRLENEARQAANLAQRAEQLADQKMRALEDDTDAPSREVEELRWEADQIAQEQEQLDRENNEQRAAERAEQLEQHREEFADRAEAAADHLAERAANEQASAASNPQEAQDLAHAARALDDLADAVADAETGEQAREAAAEFNELRDAMEATEAAARAEDAAESLEALAENEEAAQAQPQASSSGESSSQEPSPTTENAELAEQVADDLRRLPEEINRALDEPAEAQRTAQQAANSPEAREVAREMAERQRADQRGENGRQEQSQSENIESLSEDVAAVQEQLESAAAEAREQLEAMAPEARELLREMAGDLQEAAEAAESLAAQAESQAAESGESSEGSEAANKQLADAAADILDDAEDARDSLEDAAAAFADEASREDLSSPEGREAARDADDAIAQLREDAAPMAEAAESALASAAMPETPLAEKAATLNQAAAEKKALAEKLESLADQLDAIAEGDPAAAEAARTALRDTESETGVEGALEESYAQAEDLAELMTAAAGSPEAALSALEEELANNPQMQTALGELAAEKAMDAAAELAQAAAKESSLAEAMEQGQAPQAGSPQSPAASEQSSINETAQQAAADLASAADHQERLGETSAGESLQQASESASEFAEQGEGEQALGQLSSNPSPSANQPAVENASEALSQTAQSAAEAAAKASQAAAYAAAETPSGSAQQQASASSLAEALDTLAEMVNNGEMTATEPNASEAAPGAPPSGQPAPSEAAASAQALLAQAQAQQAAAMAAARAQGQTPGAQQQASGQQMASANSNASQPNAGQPGQPSQQAAEGSSAAPTAVTLLAGTTADGELDDTWGKLPPKVAKDIIEASRSSVSPDYRSAIESYYKAIADRARAKN